MTTYVGTCSICRGRVSVPSIWHGVIPPTPRCESCGAVPQQPYGPVIPMQRVVSSEAWIKPNCDDGAFGTTG